jgi:glycosyltransferase involved in cell wall biosynthesis
VRIALCVPKARFLEASVGGDPVMVRSLHAALLAAGHHVEYVSRLDSCEFGRGRVPARHLLTEVVAVRRRMQAFAPDAWLVYSPSSQEPDLFGWWQRPRRYMLFGAHAPSDGPDGGGWRRWLLTWAHRRSLARADRIAAWRPTSLDKLIAAGVPRERLSFLLPAAEVWPDLPPRDAARRRLGLPTDATIILSAARFSASKVSMMLKLMDALDELPPHVRLLLVGDDDPRRAHLEEAARRRPAGRVQVVVSLDRAAMPVYYAACDIYAYPHSKDTPWVSVLEAQGCGRPVVTLRTHSAELTVQHGRTGLLARDEAEWRGQLKLLVGDPAGLRAMGEAARAYVTAQHSIATRARQIEALLLEREPVSACLGG